MEKELIISNIEAVINRCLKAGLLTLEEAVELSRTLENLKQKL